MPVTPTKLGRYEIVQELGKGAMGVVYLAKDPLIGRMVALKTFRVGFTVLDEELHQFRVRFMREAQSAGILSHPNVVTIHDVVEASDEGGAFIAMEYVRGTTLKDMLQSGESLELPFVVDVLAQVADALDYAHSKGVIHRDIKPANILITTAEKRAKIADFGIARINTSNLTQDGQLMGTPNYMAPEQVLGKEADHRADIFSLGVVLYEMLTRKKPFQGENLTVVTHRIVYEPFTPPEDYVPGFPEEIKAVLTRALEKSPDRRFQSAGEMAAALRRAAAPTLDPDQTLATTSITPPVAPAGKGRARRLALAGAGLALVAALALGAVYVTGRREPAAPVPAADPAAEQLKLAEVRREEGRQLLLAGDAASAARLLAEAESLAPGLAGVRELRDQAQQEMAAAEQRGQRDAAIGETLERARDLLAKRRYEEAKSAAQSVLALDASHAAAQLVVAEADAGLAQRREERARAAVAPSTAPSGPVAAAGAAQTPGGPAAGAAASPDSRLILDFQSDAPEGVLTIYVGSQQVFRDSFRFVRRRGLRSEAASGTMTARRSVPSGDARVRVYLALEGRPTRTQQIEGNLPAGGARTLRIRVDRSGEFTSALD